MMWVTWVLAWRRLRGTMILTPVSATTLTAAVSWTYAQPISKNFNHSCSNRFTILSFSIFNYKIFTNKTKCAENYLFLFSTAKRYNYIVYWKYSRLLKLFSNFSDHFTKLNTFCCPTNLRVYDTPWNWVNADSTSNNRRHSKFDGFDHSTLGDCCYNVVVYTKLYGRLWLWPTNSHYLQII